MNFPTTFLGWVAFLAEKYGPDFMRGLGVTLQLATIGTGSSDVCLVSWSVWCEALILINILQSCHRPSSVSSRQSSLFMWR